ncbi:MAG: 3-dehydroquinate synthase [Firmicutes bacterium]|nr:3-dehydroquinate synthase [Bacillota bacterium]
MILDVALGEKSYDIVIEKDSLKKAGKFIHPFLRGNKVVLITDRNVDKYYGNLVLHSLVNEGIDAVKMVIEPGESSKSIDKAMEIYKFLLDNGVGRKDLLVALGGGVIGDLVGYCAATYLRGIDFFQIPTSLLAQIDSSIGGKVAIDLPYGKNLVGAFYQPKGVLIDETTLTTLEEKFFIDGMAEAIKYGAIFSEEFFSYLEIEDFSLASIKNGKSMEKVIYECCNFKRQVVEEDEFENGRRALLNFGHTAGHGIEKVEGFVGHSHGEAVGIGMCLIAKAGESLGVTKIGTYERLKKLVAKTGLPVQFPVKIKGEVVKAMGYDKKAQGGGIKLIMLSEIGKSFIMEEKKENLKNLVDRGI